MKTRSIIGIEFGLLLLVMMLTSVISVEASYSKAPDIKVILLNQDPDPVQPGRLVDLRFKVQNFGTDSSDNITIKILPEFPFKLYSPADSEINIGPLSGLQTGEDSVIVKYRMAVDPSAVEGENEIKISYKLSDGTAIIPEAFNVSVKTADSIIAVESVTTEDEVFMAGEQGKVNILVSSLTAAPIKNLKIMMDLTGTVFSAYQGSNERILESLPGLATKSVEFNLIAASTAVSGVHPLTITLSWDDLYGTSYSKNVSTSLVVRNVPSYLVKIEDSDALIEKKAGKLVLSLSNTGIAEIRYATLELLPSSEYELLSAPISYLGNLESDDYETTEYDIVPGYANGNKNLDVKAKVVFKDEFDKTHSSEHNLQVMLYNDTEAIKLGLTKPPRSNVPIIAGLSILLVVVLVWRWRKKIKR